ncbi:MAG: hypothetical protein ABI625_12875 [bacterium]
MELILVVVGVSLFLIGQHIGRTSERNAWQARLLKEGGRPPVGPAGEAPAFDIQSIGQRLDAMALEIERIGESQRFLTRVLSQPERLLDRSVPSSPTAREGPSL